MTGNARTARPRRTSGRRASWWFAACAAVAGCAATPPEEALRQSVAELESAIEAREPSGVAEVLARDFAGPAGMDRTAARRLAQLSFLRHRDVGLVLGPLDLAVQGDHATVRFTAAVTGGSGAWLPERGSVYRVETGWRLEGGTWRMTSAGWERDL